MTLKLKETLNWSSLDCTNQQSICSRPTQINEEQSKVDVLNIFDAVSKNGDLALLDYGKKWDSKKLKSIKVPVEELKKSCGEISPELKDAINNAISNITTFHKLQKPQNYSVETQTGVSCSKVYKPFPSVGIYVPGGNAPLVSSLLMSGVLAKLADVKNITVCTPAQNETGLPAVSVMAACQLLGISNLFAVGGAQAIAALTLGTKSIAKVDKIFGPGNLYVTQAKQIANQRYKVGIDMPAGPSEVMVVSDNNKNSEWNALDLLSQAEHGPDSQAVFVSTSLKDIKDTKQFVQKFLNEHPNEQAVSSINNSLWIQASNYEEIIKISETYGPEHLILNCENQQKILDQINFVGSVFLGPYTPESLGDYASGTNHVLPTDGWAKSTNGLSLTDFYKSFSVQQATAKGLLDLGTTVEILAQEESLTFHKLAVSNRRSYLNKEGLDG